MLAGFQRDTGQYLSMAAGVVFGILAEAGGSITPIEAALQTSLTVDEADEILSRFAYRGHLLVENRDGVLSYALPSRRIGGP
jgi:hypothetical protein